MTELKRWDIEYTGHAYSEYRDMVEEPDGEYVLFTDYEAKCADYERLREALEIAWPALRRCGYSDKSVEVVAIEKALAPPPAAGIPEEADAGVAARKAEESSSGGRK